MPEMSLNAVKNTLTITGVPGKTEPMKIHYPSDEANRVIEEAADERSKSVGVIVESLFQGKTIEF